MSFSGIYCITNKIDGKVYVGQAKNIKIRINQHKNKLKNGIHSNPFLQEEYNKNGLDVFFFSVIEKIKIYNSEKMVKRERYWIKKLKSRDRNFGYNIYDGARPPSLGIACSDEHKEKISLALQGRKKTEEHLLNISLNRVYKKGKDNPITGTHQSEEHLEKRAKSMIGNTNKFHKKTKNPTSEYFGVYINRRDGTWIAQLVIDGKAKRIGSSYKTEKGAAQAYNLFVLNNLLLDYPLNNVEDD